MLKDFSNVSSIYYAMAIMWPSMVAVLYTDDGGASMYAGWLSCVSTAGINWGMIIGGFLAEPIGKTKYQCVSMFTIGGILFGCKSNIFCMLRSIGADIMSRPCTRRPRYEGTCYWPYVCWVLLNRMERDCDVESGWNRALRSARDWNCYRR